MIRTLAVGLIFSFFAVGFAQEEEPKLERKKKDDTPEKKEAKKDEKVDPKEKSAPEPAPKNPTEADIEKAKERIIENSKTASKRLEEKDPSEGTRKVQQEILKDLDELLKQAQNQQNQQNSQQPMGGGASGPGQLPMKGGGTGQQKQSSQGSSSRQERKERREQAKQNSGGAPQEKQEAKGSPMSQGKENGKEGAKENTGNLGSPSGGSPMNPNAKPNAKFAEIYKDVWGHLPEKLRQEMDLYYREQFMPRYTELLREYYSSLAEQRKKLGK
jgi:hypothetical protein